MTRSLLALVLVLVACQDESVNIAEKHFPVTPSNGDQKYDVGVFCNQVGQNEDDIVLCRDQRNQMFICFTADTSAMVGCIRAFDPFEAKP